MTQIPWLDDNELYFPPTEAALEDPDGLLAAGGDLRPERLLQAYERGIFPWYEDGQPILWWCPSPRTVLFPEELHISRSLKKTLRKDLFRVTADTDFSGVIRGCSESRHYAEGTWITEEMIDAYRELHQRGYAHSIEVWQQDELVGGLYGIALGKVFFGESMFSRETDASKVAFAYLVGQLQSWGFKVIDCQIASQHLESFGAREISRSQFQELLVNYSNRERSNTHWKLTYRFQM